MRPRPADAGIIHNDAALLNVFADELPAFAGRIKRQRVIDGQSRLRANGGGSHI
jgi:hypothetical protein